MFYSALFTWKLNLFSPKSHHFPLNSEVTINVHCLIGVTLSIEMNKNDISLRIYSVVG